MGQLEQFGHGDEHSDERQFGAGAGVSGETAQNRHDAAKLLREIGAGRGEGEGDGTGELFRLSGLHDECKKMDYKGGCHKSIEFTLKSSL